MTDKIRNIVKKKENVNKKVKFFCSKPVLIASIAAAESVRKKIPRAVQSIGFS